jgi:hypothetical protein
MKPTRNRNLRRYHRQTNRRLVIGFFLILFILGDGMIWYFYGKESALFGLLCLVAGSTPIFLVSLILWGMDKFVQRMREDGW